MAMCSRITREAGANQANVLILENVSRQWSKSKPLLRKWTTFGEENNRNPVRRRILSKIRRVTCYIKITSVTFFKAKRTYEFNWGNWIRILSRLLPGAVEVGRLIYPQDRLTLKQICMEDNDEACLRTSFSRFIGQSTLTNANESGDR